METRFGDARVSEAVPLAPLTTLRVGPVAREFVAAATVAQIVAALTELDADPDRRVLVLAGGSNVLLADDLTDLTVVHLGADAVDIDGATVRVQAGAVWDDVVAATVTAGLGGLECLSGIPGSAGATPVQNVGAYGAEVADTLSAVRLLDRRSGTVEWVDPARLAFGYRSSILKHSDRHVVLEAEFTLDPAGRSAPLRYGELATALGAEPGERADPAAVRAAVLALRAGKGMVLDAADHDTWSAGSFFTNPVVDPALYERIVAASAAPVPHYPAPDGVKLAAGWLVEAAGFTKGYPGAGAPARLSTKHALAVTNRGVATSADVLALARRVRDGVRDSFGITLVPEPVLVGCTL
ncbi:UDP-N-acetylmuramate dehydrogenase [Mycobacterium koreense]|uniref:UDP-N-acetylenolpyruvoylglucosamine reductase n=1 Tax=Mycolicibacillus koreensis TaxID=1069220 RepID=A0A7I7SGF2_9MYCO|nr:UDP-N-acetylmuramate dehydrogenase [Mycolicibacillus koreensis]MCV7248349.1 UDP-N-acetylmuramate dehydrogenase [Mycolicibacillus koreensis]OSC34300.1 UDP-N-acetylenolpyruvoylglucosamine reductase [Mycolicibacillus koreensis]BBY55289.1 UDP-N-acetylenolpyruvoylglucosamine reductase [Mycolicibacillus koreensis]